MRKDKWKKTLIAVGIIVLFILIILTVFAFQHESEEVIIDDRSPEVEEEIVFENNSDYTEEEIRDITENLRESLRDLLSNIEYYKISENGKDFRYGAETKRVNYIKFTYDESL